MELKCNQQFVVSSSPPASLDVRNNSKMDVSNGEARLNGLKSCEDVAEDKEAVNESDAEEEPDPLFGFDRGMYEVESIIAKRKRKESGFLGTRLNEYYIKWVGWPYRTCTWQLASDFGEVDEVKAEFNARERALKVVMEQPDHRFWSSRIRQLHSLTRWESSINAILRNESRQILYIYNDVDEERARHDFTYIISNKYHPEVEGYVRRALWSSACICGGACGSGSSCCPAKEGYHFFYTKSRRIRSTFYADEKSAKPGILVECNDECKCGYSCPTKLVQKGRRYKVAIVRREELTLNYFGGRDYEESGDADTTNESSKGRECLSQKERPDILRTAPRHLLKEYQNFDQFDSGAGIYGSEKRDFSIARDYYMMGRPILDDQCNSHNFHLLYGGAKKQSITTTAPSAGTGTATGNAADAAAKPSQPSVPKAAEQQNQPKKDEPGGTSTDKKNEEKIPDDLKSKSKSGKANDDHEKSKAAEAKGNAAAPAAGDEDEGGYESCPDMTPEQLAKIANEPAPK
ncbi:Histone-lysine N-methyltransferase SUV39H2 [Toxocara canis]|uniref:Histone-lysine N-methyltransferase SUV39H2 n=1 Tax=Toxocara canis TaxID=6265 RepID=A0A0B2VEA9_TOXCA|nr:Histone-lysine N-methyltransferase SUV39H2 [Toxocara canis]